MTQRATPPLPGPLGLTPEERRRQELLRIVQQAFANDDEGLRNPNLGLAPPPEPRSGLDALSDLGGQAVHGASGLLRGAQDAFNNRPFQEQSDRFIIDPFAEAGAPIVNAALAGLERADRFIWRPLGTAGYATVSPSLGGPLEALGEATGKNYRPHTAAFVDQLMEDGWQRGEEGGIDFDTTLNKLQDTLNAPPGALGLSEAIFDPLNLIPGGQAAKLGGKAARGLLGGVDEAADAALRGIGDALPTNTPSAQFFDSPNAAMRAEGYRTPPAKQFLPTGAQPDYGDIEDINRVVGEEVGAIADAPDALRELGLPGEDEIRRIFAERDVQTAVDFGESNMMSGRNAIRYSKHMTGVGNALGFEGQDLNRFRMAYLQGMKRGLAPYEAIERASTAITAAQDVATAAPQARPGTTLETMGERNQSALDRLRQRETAEQAQQIEFGIPKLQTVDPVVLEKTRAAQMLASRELDEGVSQINSFRVDLENQMMPEGGGGRVLTEPAQAVIQQVLDKYGDQLLDDLSDQMARARWITEAYDQNGKQVLDRSPVFPGDPSTAAEAMQTGDAEMLTVAWDLILKHTGRDALGSIDEGGLGLRSVSGRQPQFGAGLAQSGPSRRGRGTAAARQAVEATGAQDMFAGQQLEGQAATRRPWGPGAAAAGEFDPVAQDFDAFAQRFDEMRGTEFRHYYEPVIERGTEQQGRRYVRQSAERLMDWLAGANEGTMLEAALSDEQFRTLFRKVYTFWMANSPNATIDELRHSEGIARNIGVETVETAFELGVAPQTVREALEAGVIPEAFAENLGTRLDRLRGGLQRDLGEGVSAAPPETTPADPAVIADLQQRLEQRNMADSRSDYQRSEQIGGAGAVGVSKAGELKRAGQAQPDVLGPPRFETDMFGDPVNPNANAPEELTRRPLSEPDTSFEHAPDPFQPGPAGSRVPDGTGGVELVTQGVGGAPDLYLLPLDRIRIEAGAYQNRDVGGSWYDAEAIRQLREDTAGAKQALAFQLDRYGSEMMEVWWNPEQGTFDLLGGHHRLRMAEEDGYTQLRTWVYSEAGSTWQGNRVTRDVAEEIAAATNDKSRIEGIRGESNAAFSGIQKFVEEGESLQNAFRRWASGAAGRRRDRAELLYNYHFAPGGATNRIKELETVAEGFDARVVENSTRIAARLGKYIREGSYTEAAAYDRWYEWTNNGTTAVITPNEAEVLLKARVDYAQSLRAQLEQQGVMDFDMDILLAKADEDMKAGAERMQSRIRTVDSEIGRVRQTERGNTEYTIEGGTEGLADLPVPDRMRQRLQQQHGEDLGEIPPDVSLNQWREQMQAELDALNRGRIQEFSGKAVAQQRMDMAHGTAAVETGPEARILEEVRRQQSMGQQPTADTVGVELNMDEREVGMLVRQLIGMQEITQNGGALGVVDPGQRLGSAAPTPSAAIPDPVTPRTQQIRGSMSAGTVVNRDLVQPFKDAVNAWIPRHRRTPEAQWGAIGYTAQAQGIGDDAALRLFFATKTSNGNYRLPDLNHPSMLDYITDTQRELVQRGRAKHLSQHTPLQTDNWISADNGAFDPGDAPLWSTIRTDPATGTAREWLELEFELRGWQVPEFNAPEQATRANRADIEASVQRYIGYIEGVTAGNPDIEHGAWAAPSAIEQVLADATARRNTAGGRLAETLERARAPHARRQAGTQQSSFLDFAQRTQARQPDFPQFVRDATEGMTNAGAPPSGRPPRDRIRIGDWDFEVPSYRQMQRDVVESGGDTLDKLAEFLRDMKSGWVVDAVNRAGGFKKLRPEQQVAAIGTALRVESREQFKRGARASIDSRYGTDAQVYGPLDQYGRMQMPGPLHNMTVTDFIEALDAPMRATLGSTQKGRLMINKAEQYIRMYDDLRAAYKKQGFDVGKVQLSEELKNYAAHVVVGREVNGEVVETGFFAPQGGPNLPPRLTTKAGPEHHRLIQTEKQLRESGFKVLTAEDALVHRWAEFGQRMSDVSTMTELRRMMTVGEFGDRAQIVTPDIPGQTWQADFREIRNDQVQVKTRNLHFTGPEARQIQQTILNEFTPGANTPEKGWGWARSTSGAARTVLLTADISFFAQQGFGPMANELAQVRKIVPTAFRSVGEQAQGLVSKKALEETIQARAVKMAHAFEQNHPQKYPQLPWSFGERSEYTQGTSTIGKIPLLGRGYEAAGQVYDDFRLTFSLTQAGINEERIAAEFGEKLAEAQTVQEILGAGLARTPQDADGLLQQVRNRRRILGDQSAKMAGALPHYPLVAGRTQRMIEHLLIFLAPSWRRSQIGLMGEGLLSFMPSRHPNELFASGRGGRARRILMQRQGLKVSILGMATIAAGVQAGLSEEEIRQRLRNMVNPTHGDYDGFTYGSGTGAMKFRFGGPDRSVLRLMGEMYLEVGTQAGIEPAAGGYVPRGDKGEVKHPLESARDSVRGMTAPLSGMAWNLVEGQDFMGNDTRPWTKDGLRNLVVNNTVPIMLQEMIEWNEVGTVERALIAAVASGVGMNPAQPSAANLREDKTRELYGSTGASWDALPDPLSPREGLGLLTQQGSSIWENLSEWEKDWVYSETEEQTRPRVERALDRGDRWAERSYGFLTIEEERTNAMLELSGQVLAEEVDAFQVRNEWIIIEKMEEAGKNVQFAIIERLRAEQDPGSMEEDIIDRYYQMIRAAGETLQDPDERETFKQAWMAENVPSGSEIEGELLRGTNVSDRMPLPVLKMMLDAENPRAQSIILSELMRIEYLEEQHGPEVAQAHMRWFFYMDEGVEATQGEEELPAA